LRERGLEMERENPWEEREREEGFNGGLSRWRWVKGGGSVELSREMEKKGEEKKEKKDKKNNNS